ncbi:endoplasmin homolog isoform X4 [Physcomitrium patens]|uniref:endoplasmin homolog isoform X4 n=1 Tax=Physcomitrium patens TaxID=3218 RepID=UPI000D176267|nr:endoplasmin homolog isoform X4 [Physcomitrium patens]|eukprot:XP_024383099.1 endoplasmin homolog isoform X4 [Physcomitrella patens]
MDITYDIHGNTRLASAGIKLRCKLVKVVMTRFAAVTALCALLTITSIQDPHAGVAAQDGVVVEPVSAFAKVENRIGAVPLGSTTDAELVARERDTLAPKERRNGESFEFQAEVSRLMDIIINSLYSNKDIFLRELVSNASDALDKIRFLSLMDKTLLSDGKDAELDIHIKVDKKENVLSIRDNGVGMTKEDLIKNLGTVAKSGTSSFLDQIQSGGDLNLIGQFGVGFYSVYLIADYVEVISKQDDDKQYIWESSADGSFSISEDTENEPLGRGTDIRIHLKENAAEYAAEGKLRVLMFQNLVYQDHKQTLLKLSNIDTGRCLTLLADVCSRTSLILAGCVLQELVQKYCQFINFPIYLWVGKEIEDPVEEDKDTAIGKGTSAENLEDKKEETEDEPDREEAAEPKTKPVKRTEWNWEYLNNMKAIWLRNPKDITPEEYNSFYHSLTKDFSEDDPLAWTHFNAEGDVEFKAVLFIPSKASQELFDDYYTNTPQLKLYIRRIFTSDGIDELLPKYLAFLKGIVDSDTLPINVSREMLQQLSSLKTLKKKVVRKALDMIKRIMDDDPDEIISEDEDGLEDNEEEQTNEKKGKYAVFWKEYGNFIKMGVLDDSANRKRLAKLIRFQSSKSGEKLASFDQYVARMKPDQSHIYFMTGQDKNQLKNSPLLEKLLKNEYEVIYFVDPLDEYVMQHLTEYEDKVFQDASKDSLKILGKEGKVKMKKAAKMYKKLTRWWKDLLAGESIGFVKVSARLANTPAVVVTSRTGWSSNMERVVLAQALVDPSKVSQMKSKRILEINPRHPIIRMLLQKVTEDPAVYPNAQVEEEEDEVDLKDDDSELNNFELEGTGENDNGAGNISDPEPVNMLTEHFEDIETRVASDFGRNAPPSNDVVGEDDVKRQIFKEASQIFKPDSEQSLNDEL